MATDSHTEAIGQTQQTTGLAAAYAPYDSMPEFQHGFDAYLANARCPHDVTSEQGIAWLLGMEAAARYQRAVLDAKLGGDDA